MSEDKKRFFQEFSEVDKKGWKEQIIKDLKGADYDEKLILKSKEGFDIAPFYHQEDAQELRHHQYNGWRSEALINSLSPRQWENRAYIEVDDLAKSNKAAILALQNGADGIEFKLTQSVDHDDLRVLLNDILLEYCAVSFSTDQSLVSFGRVFVEYIRSQQYPLDKITGTLKGDHTKLTDTERNEYINLFSELANYRVFTVEATDAETTTGQLAQILDTTISLIDHLSKEGLKVDVIILKLEFRIHAVNDYFKQIASLRALRMLLDLVVKQYGVNDFDAANLNIHCITAILVDDATKADPYLNMLSNTNQAMASIIGGCDSLTILPHNLGIEDVGQFALRIARNVSNVLKEESYFDKVADPSSGSYYIEDLTHKIADKSWELFQGL